MGLRSSARSLLSTARDRVRAILNPPQGPYRPDLTDAAFIECLPPATDLLRAAKESYAAGDQAGARRGVVDHFLERKTPRFFCDPGQVDTLAATLRRDRPAWAAALRARVDADLNAGLRILSMQGAPLAGPFEWEGIPLGPGGDNLFSVQPHRYGFMPRLALAAHHGMPTPGVIAALLDRWMAVTGAGEPMSYLSPLVVLYRVLALSWTFTFIAGLPSGGGASSHDLLFRILKILCADAEHLRHTIGDSYPNNHLLADGFAGWYCGTLFPEFPGAAPSREKGEGIFLRELRRQFYDDGASFEHSTHYQELGCEMTVAYVLLSRRNGIEPAGDVVERLRRMLGFQTALNGPEAVPVPIGDAIEDPLFPLDAGHGWAAGAMRELYRALFDAGIDAPPESDLTVARAFWLLGGALAPPSPSAAGVVPAAFEQSGFYVLSDSIRQARLVFRSGPVEGLPISAGHAHADLLSVYLRVDGVPLIVDSGTYTYYLKSARWPALAPDWRSYLAGPEAHNGLMPGSDPYGAMLGNFRNRDIPCRVACRRRVERPRLAWLEFETTGASAASGHRRGVVHVVGHYWLIYDLVPAGVRAKGASIGLQFAPGTHAEIAGGGTVDAVAGGARCRIALSAGLRDPCIVTGSTKPLAGWVSPRYGEIVPAPQLRARIAANGEPCGFVLQASRGEAENCSIAAAMAGDSWVAFRVEDGGCVDLLLVRTSNGGPPMAAWDIEFDGALAWLRTAAGKICESRRADAGELRYRGRLIE